MPRRPDEMFVLLSMVLGFVLMAFCWMYLMAELVWLYG